METLLGEGKERCVCVCVRVCACACVCVRAPACVGGGVAIEPLLDACIAARVGVDVTKACKKTTMVAAGVSLSPPLGRDVCASSVSTAPKLEGERKWV